MGVLGLTPFLAKYCPDVLKELPNGIKSISGKTVAIDATLLTQRFHYAGIVSNRHVLGWYRLITNLRANNVNAICVFDGKERGLAKARELQRRRENRATSIARENLELERLNRLATLQKLVRKVRALPPKQRGVVAEELRPFVHVEPSSPPLVPPSVVVEETDRGSLEEETLPETSDDESGADVKEDSPSSAMAPEQKEVPEEDQPVESIPSIPESPVSEQVSPEPVGTAEMDSKEDLPSPVTIPELNEVSRDQPVESLPSIPESPVLEQVSSESAVIAETDLKEDSPSSVTVPELKRVPEDGQPVESSTSIPESPVSEEVSSEPTGTAETLIKELTSKLIDLRKKYSDSLPSFANLQIAVPSSHPTTTMTTQEEELDPNPEFHAAASRHQYHLALQEGEAWAKLVEHRPNAIQNAEHVFIDLRERSQILTDTYQRRNEFPTRQTYEDAKSLLVAMGVPCVESDAPYEGEGLASAIVLAGHADFVISEDTDVVVYGAPLLRNVTDSKKPILELDSRAVQEALSLSRDPFVDFALLLGTDFTSRLRRVGPVRALKFIQEHGSIEEIVKMETKYPPQFDLPEYLAQVELGRNVFRSLPPVPSPEKLRQIPVDDANVQAVIEGFGLSPETLAQEESFFTVVLKGNYFGDNPHLD